MYLLVIIIGINCVSANPTINPSPVAEVDENGNITMTCSPIIKDNLWESFNPPSTIYITSDCEYINSSGHIEAGTSVTCQVRNYSALILSRVSRYRHGQIWYCRESYSAISSPTVIAVRGRASTETCSHDNELEVCPYPVAYFVENHSVKISARYTGSHMVQSIKWSEYIKNWVHMSHLVYPNCSYGYGDVPDGYEFLCNSSKELFTMVIKDAREYMHGQMLKIEIEFLSVSTISNYIILSLDATLSNGTVPQTPSTTSKTPTVEARTSEIPNGTKPQDPLTERRISTVEPTTLANSNEQITQASSTTRTVTYRPIISIASTRTAAISSSPFPTRVSSYEPDPAEYEIQMVFKVKVEMEFSENYRNKLSSEFQSLARNFTSWLTDIYKNVMGFKSIEILRFSPSIIAEYAINFYANIDVGRVTNEIKAKVVNSIRTIAGAHVDTEYTMKEMTELIDVIRKKDRCSLASVNLCHFGYYCKPLAGVTVVCVDRCNSTICQNNGECYIGHRHSDVQCSCPYSSDVVYSGSRCEIMQEVLLPRQKINYIIIGSSLILGIIIIYIVTIVILKRQIIRQKEKIYKQQKREEAANDNNAVNFRRIIDTSATRPRGLEVHRGHTRDRYREPGYSDLTPQNQREDSTYDYIDLQHSAYRNQTRFDYN